MLLLDLLHSSTSTRRKHRRTTVDFGLAADAAAGDGYSLLPIIWSIWVASSVLLPLHEVPTPMAQITFFNPSVNILIARCCPRGSRGVIFAMDSIAPWLLQRCCKDGRPTLAARPGFRGLLPGAHLLAKHCRLLGGICPGAPRDSRARASVHVPASLELSQWRIRSSL